MNNISKCHQFLVHGTDLTGLPLEQIREFDISRLVLLRLSAQTYEKLVNIRPSDIHMLGPHMQS